jgi:transposase
VGQFLFVDLQRRGRPDDRKGSSMEAIIERAAGLDVHQATVVAAVLIGKATGRARKEVRTFGTMTQDLEALRDWLYGLGITHVRMESTGVYWMPVYTVLTGHFTLIVGNAHHIKNVPGRKTDVKDAEWIADLVRHGLIKASFVPSVQLRELRDLLRYRRSLAQTVVSVRNRTLKLLESANIKLASVATDVFGVSGMAMLGALAEGDATPDAMAALAKGKLRRKQETLAQALNGRLTENHRFVLRLHLRQLDRLEADIAELDDRIADRMSPYRKQQKLLTQIPGVDDLAAANIIAEIGVDMSVFGTACRLAAWAGVCPGSHESAGKRRRAGTRKGNLHLKTTLVMSAMSAARTRGSYYRDKYYRLKARCGGVKAAMAIAHKILVAVFHMLANDAPFQELGAAYLDQRSKQRVAKALVRRLDTLGYNVQLEPKAA